VKRSSAAPPAGGVKRVAALERGLAVLRHVQDGSGVTLHDLHTRTGIAKATLLRALRTLEDNGFVARRLADGAYLPSGMSGAALPRPAFHERLVEIITPSLQRLSRRIPWPTDVAVRDATTMLVLESNRRLTSISVNRQVLGFRPHMLWSAMGRAYLAFCGDAEREEILDLLRRSNREEDRAARDNRRIAQVLADTRARGYAVRDARHAGIDVAASRQVSAIAVPALSGDRVVACLNCVWVTDLLPEAEIVKRYLDALRSAAQEIGMRGAALR
jgi:IclR family mhp operon transcriptional activator